MIDIWILKSKKDIDTAQDLFKTKHYDWSLFMWHLAIEKILKAHIISLDKEIKFTHDLEVLAKETELSFEPAQLKAFHEITSFNIEARYDDYKFTFYKKATQEYTETWSKACEQLYTFVKKHL